MINISKDIHRCSLMLMVSPEDDMASDPKTPIVDFDCHFFRTILTETFRHSAKYFLILGRCPVIRDLPSHCLYRMSERWEVIGRNSRRNKEKTGRYLGQSRRMGGGVWQGPGSNRQPIRMKFWVMGKNRLSVRVGALGALRDRVWREISFQNHRDCHGYKRLLPIVKPPHPGVTLPYLVCWNLTPLLLGVSMLNLPFIEARCLNRLQLLNLERNILLIKKSFYRMRQRIDS